MKQDGYWILPVPGEGVSVKITESLHRKPEMCQFTKQIGRVDQEVVHDRDLNKIEFYRFKKGKVLLLGMTSSDKVKPFTMFDPPLEIWPGNEMFKYKKCMSDGVTQVWDGLKKEFSSEQKTRITFVLKEQGMVNLEKEYIQAVLYEMSISQDKTVGFGGTDLIVPDAVSMQSSILMVEGIGPVLEWGIRTKTKDEIKIQQPNKRMSEPQELYIEITFHHSMN